MEFSPTTFSGSSDFYLADNYFIGRDDPNHLLGWIGNFWTKFDGVEGQKFPPILASYTAVRLYGPGHVVAYNYIANFHDGVDIETYGNPDGSHAIDGPHYPPKEYWDRRPVAIDYYNNYMTNFHDNAFEIDGSMHNVRVMRNMMVNSASQPFCNQPAIGGPIYWIRNIAYHAPGGSTRMTNGAAGVLFYNNTILTETNAGSSANTHWRNNLMLGENSAPAIFSVNTYTNYSSSDYNGFRPNPGVAYSFQWNSPPWNILVDYSALTSRTGSTLVSRRFATLAEYSLAAQQDQHSVAVDYDVFANVPRLDAQDVIRVQKLSTMPGTSISDSNPVRRQLIAACTCPILPTTFRATRRILERWNLARLRLITVRDRNAHASLCSPGTPAGILRVIPTGLHRCLAF